ncbi:MAG: peptidylprolyl isomerase [Syntrophobacteraceae bacterium]|jgi:FKBP-type peptidyl-prolyl cis-trans isomerase 2|nr:peptidylprolyl isomerase [Syntrophobacteraceae bacterium]
MDPVLEQLLALDWKAERLREWLEGLVGRQGQTLAGCVGLRAEKDPSLQAAAFRLLRMEGPLECDDLPGEGARRDGSSVAKRRGRSQFYEREESMAQARLGDTVAVHYHGTLEDGTVFSSTFEEKEPFEFTIGQQRVLPLFEEAVMGLREGETVDITIAPRDGYGEHRQEFVFAMDRKQAPEHLKLELGRRLQIRSNEGKMVVATITALTDDTVVLDANDPLAGKTLNFRIELLQIKS